MDEVQKEPLILSSSSSSSSPLILPPPVSLGFDAKFSSYRAEQSQAVIDVTESKRRFRIVAAATGVGKSIIALSTILLEQARGLILTSTKALQDQYLRDAAIVGMKDIRGGNNYTCPPLEAGGQYAHLRGNGPATTDRGPCLAGLPCKLKNGGCPKYDAIRAARSADLVISNYDWWLADGKRPRKEDAEETIGDFDYLILDELHAAAEHVAKSLHIDLEGSKVRDLLGLDLPSYKTVEEWREWASGARGKLAGELDGLALELKFARDGGGVRRELMEGINALRTLDRTLAEVAGMFGRWVIEAHGGSGSSSGSGSGGGKISRSRSRYVTFDPVWVDRYAESRLYRGVPNVVGMSATVRPMEMRYLGIEDEVFDFFEYDSPFPLANRPVYRWPVVRMHWTMSDDHKRKAVEAGDVLFGARLDRRMITHSVSYERAWEIQRMSRYKKLMLLHGPRSTMKVIEAFKRHKPPVILVSPSVGTGYDFPDDECRLIWIPKVPYPGMDSALMRAKVETDRRFPSVYASKEIVQNAGRANRGMEDWAEVVITDAAFEGLMAGSGYLNFPKSFLRAMRYTEKAPAPIPLRRKR